MENVWVSYASLNIRDQIREGSDVPLQFAYEAANCRIFYTPQTIFNYTNLWTYAADAVWNKPELCVQGSTGYASNDSVIDTNGPAALAKGATSNVTYDVDGIIRLSGETYDFPAAFSGQELSVVLPTPNIRPPVVNRPQQQQQTYLRAAGATMSGANGLRGGRVPQPLILPTRFTAPPRGT